jgi:Icc-related predicted phosphoesterase
MNFRGDHAVGDAAVRAMNDFSRIRVSSPFRKKFTPAHARAMHADTLRHLRTFLAAGAKNAVVITHHAPSIRSLPAAVRDDPLSAGYASELETLILEYQPLLWVHGHIHESSRYQIGRTTIIANPRGYPDSLNPAFQDDLVIALDSLG